MTGVQTCALPICNVIGSELLGQNFTSDKYFHPRPSAAGNNGYDPTASGGSNLGPTSAPLRTNAVNNIAAFISGNNLPTNTVVPPDMIYASASGVDPHISPEAAQLQIARVALSRGLSADKVKELVAKYTEQPQWGIFGQARVNVMMLNVALDDLTKSGAVKSVALNR